MPYCKQTPTKCSEDLDPLVSYKSSTTPTATSSTPSRRRLHDAVHCSSRPRNSSRLRHVNEFPRQEDSVNMFRCAEAASFYSPFIVQTRGTITGDVTCPYLDYGNATLAGISQHLLQRLQSVMNAAVRIIYSSSRFNHITTFLRTSPMNLVVQLIP